MTLLCTPQRVGDEILGILYAMGNYELVANLFLIKDNRGKGARARAPFVSKSIIRIMSEKR